MEEHLESLHLPYTIMDAVDAADLSDEVLRSINGHRLWPEPLTPGEVGCAMSHVNAYRYLSERDIRAALIIEDDVQLAASLPERLHDIIDHLGNDGIVFLSTLLFKPTDLKTEALISGSLRLCSFTEPRKIFGTQSYLISKALAATMSTYLQPIRTVADDWCRFWSDGPIGDLKAVFPFPVLHRDLASLVRPGQGASIQPSPISTPLRSLFRPLRSLRRQRAAEKRQRSFLTLDGKPVRRTFDLR